MNFTAEIGQFTLILAFCVSAIASIVPMIGLRRRDARLLATADPLSISLLGLIAISFALLINGYVSSDFSIQNVWENSHTAKPLLYKITGTWGNHEGSMLLWVLILALFGASISLFGRHLPLDLRATTIAVQSWILFAFLAFIIFTSNPFARIWPVPPEGRDLNPILQDIGLAIHPPLLYVGYVGFSIVFAFAVAALIIGRVDQAWARWVRPWTLAAWMFLTIGISMGSYWAYYELGWGGWWFWDPVENASFMPWLVGTALLHSAIVVEKRNALRIWTILLAILTFSLSLLGTFLVRSGVLTSVHSFATDPSRGLFILAILILFIGGSLSLFAWRAEQITSRGLFAPLSREGGLVFNNIILSASCGTVLIGTLYPLVFEAITGSKISVGPPFFNLTMVPIIIPALLLMPIGPYLTWKRADIAAISQRLWGILLLAVFGGLLVYLLQGGSLAPLVMAIAFWMVLAAIYEPLWRAKLFRVPLAETIRRARNLPRSMWGASLSHMGMGLTVIGIVAASAWSLEVIENVKPKGKVQIGQYELEYVALKPHEGPNYVDRIGHFQLSKNGKQMGVMTPIKRLYTARQMPTTEAAIKTLGLSQVYLSLGDIDKDSTVVLRAYYKPWILLIWLGTLVMFFGGGLSLFDRRLRVGVPKMAQEAQQ